MVHDRTKDDYMLSWDSLRITPLAPVKSNDNVSIESRMEQVRERAAAISPRTTPYRWELKQDFNWENRLDKNFKL